MAWISRRAGAAVAPKRQICTHSTGRRQCPLGCPGCFLTDFGSAGGGGPPDGKTSRCSRGARYPRSNPSRTRQAGCRPARGNHARAQHDVGAVDVHRLDSAAHRALRAPRRGQGNGRWPAKPQVREHPGGPARTRPLRRCAGASVASARLQHPHCVRSAPTAAARPTPRGARRRAAPRVAPAAGPRPSGARARTRADPP